MILSTKTSPLIRKVTLVVDSAGKDRFWLEHSRMDERVFFQTLRTGPLIENGVVIEHRWHMIFLIDALHETDFLKRINQ